MCFNFRLARNSQFSSFNRFETGCSLPRQMSVGVKLILKWNKEKTKNVRKNAHRLNENCISFILSRKMEKKREKEFG